MIEEIRELLEIKQKNGDTVPDDISFEAVAKNFASLVKSAAKEDSTYASSGGIIVIKNTDDGYNQFTVAVVVGHL